MNIGKERRTIWIEPVEEPAEQPVEPVPIQPEEPVQQPEPVLTP
jgi:hypothetical protein